MLFQPLKPGVVLKCGLSGIPVLGYDVDRSTSTPKLLVNATEGSCTSFCVSRSDTAAFGRCDRRAQL